jgi:hypothetical protein
VQQHLSRLVPLTASVYLVNIVIAFVGLATDLLTETRYVRAQGGQCRAAGLTSRELFSGLVPPDSSRPQALSEQVGDDSGAGRVLCTRAVAGHQVWVVDGLTAVRAAHGGIGVVLAPLS